MRFKEDRHKKEYYDLFEKNNKLHEVLTMLDRFCHFEFNKDICLTSVFRSLKENTELYSSLPEEKRPKSSPHMFWKAADIRSSDFTAKEQERMLKFLNCFTYASGQGRPVSFVHAIQGNAQHFHIQCD